MGVDLMSPMGIYWVLWNVSMDDSGLLVFHNQTRNHHGFREATTPDKSAQLEVVDLELECDFLPTT
jgi:hypothetical protein